MKKFKKLAALLLALMMVLGLTACDSQNYDKGCEHLAKGEYAEAVAVFEALGDYEDSAALLAQARDGLTREALIGSWVSDDIDLTEVFLAGFAFGAGEFADTFMNHAEFEPFNIKLKLSMADNGSMELAYEEDSLRSTFESVFKSLYEAFPGYIEDIYAQTAEQYGLGIEDLLAAYGAESVDEVFVSEFGMSIEEFLDQSLSIEEMTATYSSISFNGSYSVENGVIELLISGNSDVMEYDAESDTLKTALVAELLGMDAEENIDVNFCRVAEPAA